VSHLDHDKGPTLGHRKRAAPVAAARSTQASTWAGRRVLRPQLHLRVQRQQPRGDPKVPLCSQQSEEKEIVLP